MEASKVVRQTSGQVRLIKDLDTSIEGLNVIVVEDILDTGLTLGYLLRVLQQRKPKSLRIAALLDKPERRIKDVRVDYLGFQIPNEFVVGYGLDYAERYRKILARNGITLELVASDGSVEISTLLPPRRLAKKMA